jgi:hypothetical protein
MYYQVKVPSNYLLFFVFLCVTGLSSCSFVYEKQIKGKYYIIGVDTEDELTLRYKLNSGDYVGRAPGQLLKYCFNDTFLVAKTMEYINSYPCYYIIDMTKDSELAHEEEFRIGPLTEDEFNQTWKRKINIELKNVK